MNAPLSYDDAVRRETRDTIGKAIAQTALDEIRKHGEDPEAMPLLVISIAHAVGLLSDQVNPGVRLALTVMLLTDAAKKQQPGSTRHE